MYSPANPTRSMLHHTQTLKVAIASNTLRAFGSSTLLSLIAATLITLLATRTVTPDVPYSPDDFFVTFPSGPMVEPPQPNKPSNSHIQTSTAFESGAIDKVVPVETVIPTANLSNGDNHIENRTQGGTNVEGTSTFVDGDAGNPTNFNNQIETEEENFNSVDVEPTVDMKQLLQNLHYPGIARSAGLDGSVLVMALISADGKVSQKKILRSDHKVFESAALEAIDQTAFTPATAANRNVSCWITIPINFKLK